MSAITTLTPERVPLRGTHYVEAAAFDKVVGHMREIHAENNKLAEENRELRIACDELRRATVARADAVLKSPVSFWKVIFRFRR